MTDKAKIESYLVSLSLSFEEVAENTWVIEDAEKGLENILVVLADPIVIVRVNVMRVPEQERCALFEELLRINESDMMYGAYALAGEDVVMINTLAGETLDLEEFQATLDAFGLALAQHYQRLAKYR